MIFFFLFSLSYSKNSGKVSVGTWFLGLGSSLSYMWALTFPFLYIMSPHIKEKKSGQGCQHSCLKERNKLLDGHYSHSIPFIIMAIKEKLFLSFIKTGIIPRSEILTLVSFPFPSFISLRNGKGKNETRVNLS